MFQQLEMRGRQGLQHVYQNIQSLLVDLVDLFYPKLCSACDTHLQSGESDICIQCIFQLPKTYYWDYDENPVEQLFKGRLKIDGACSFVHFTKGGIVQQMLHRLKYEEQREIGSALGRLFAQQLLTKNKFTDVDLIVPIPLHFKKEKIRGYNQSMEIALGVSEILNVKIYRNSLIRQLASETQTRKSRYDRSTNVESVFSCSNPNAFKGKSVILIDDVITTGSTLEAAGKILFDAGVAKLYILGIASV